MQNGHHQLMNQKRHNTKKLMQRIIKVKLPITQERPLHPSKACMGKTKPDKAGDVKTLIKFKR